MSLKRRNPVAAPYEAKLIARQAIAACILFRWPLKIGGCQCAM